MSKIEVFSGTIMSVVSAKPFSSGSIELLVTDDCTGVSEKLSGTNKETFRPGCRVNAVGQWREVKRQGQRERYFYAAGVFPVPHLLDVDESWIPPGYPDEQKRQFLDGSCILQQLGVEVEMARVLSSRHKNQLLMRLITIPFKILEEEGGLAFAEAEKYAKSLGLAPTTADRASAVLREILRNVQADGISSIPLSKLKEMAIKQYFTFWPIADEVLHTMEARGAITTENGEDDSTIIRINDLEKAKKASPEVRLTTGYTATDLLLLRDQDDTFVYEEVVRTISEHFQCPLEVTRHLVLIIDTADGPISTDLPGRLNSLANKIGSSSLHCSAIKTLKNSRLTALDRYLVGIGDLAPELIIVEDAHLLDFRKLQILAQRIKNSESLILFGNGSYQSGKDEPSPLSLLIGSKKIPTVKAKEKVFSS